MTSSFRLAVLALAASICYGNAQGYKRSQIKALGTPHEFTDTRGRSRRSGDLDLQDLDLDIDEIEVQLLGDELTRTFKKVPSKARSSGVQNNWKAFYGESNNGSIATMTMIETVTPNGIKHLVGTVQDGAMIYQIRQLPNNQVIVEKRLSSDFEDGNGATKSDTVTFRGGEQAPDKSTPDLETGARKLLRGPTNNSTMHRQLQDDGSVIDVMVIYTRGAMCSAAGYGQGGTCDATSENMGTIEGLIALAVQETNTAYELSNIPSQLRLVKVHFEETYNDYGNSWESTLDNLRGNTDGYMDYVHTMRDEYGADFVSMIVDSNDVCGLGYRPNTPDASLAFTLVKWDCATGYYSFGHEMAHNMGCNHDRNNADGGGTYNYGYQYTGGQVDSFRTIMAYDCDGGCPRIQLFSSPNVYYNGVPVGDASTADNARWITERLSAYGQYRNSVSTGGGGSGGGSGSSSETVTVAIMTDAYPEELAWSIISDTSGSTVVERQAGYYNDLNSMVYEYVELTAGESYWFRISDSAGDGICCTYGEGFYGVYANDGYLFNLWGNYGSGVDQQFTVPGTA